MIKNLLLKLLFFLSVFALSQPLAKQANAKILFYENFEDAVDYSQDWAKISEGEACDKGVREISQDYARAGSKSMKFAVTWTKLERVHNEIKFNADVLNNGGHSFMVGQTYWIGFSTFVESDFTDSRGGIAFQLHDSPDDLDRCPNGEISRNPMLVLYQSTSSFGWLSRWAADPCQSERVYDGDLEYDVGEINAGTWVDWVINWRPSYKEDGILKIWKNGTLVVDQRGPNCFNDLNGSTLRFGIYEYDWGNNEPDEKSKHIVRYYDEFRIGDENSSFDEVTPAQKIGMSFPKPINLRLN